MLENRMPEHRESGKPAGTGTLNFPPADFGQAGRELTRISIGPAQTSLRQALCEIAALSASVLRVERVSFWRLVAEGRILVCEYLHQRGQEGVYEGAILHSRDFPAYFGAMNLKQVLPLPDVNGNPDLLELQETYLIPLGIVSRLHAPILTGNDICGVVCHESVDERRDWTAAERKFAGAVAEAVSRVHEEWYRMKSPRLQAGDPERTLSLERMVTFGRLSSGMAHDFKNFLAIISGYAELIGKLCEAPAPPDAARITGYAEAILAAAAQGEHLSRDLLALGHEEPGRPGVLDLLTFLGGCKGILAMGARPGVELSVEGGSGVSRVFIDRVHLERALLNLVMNAAEAMPSGGRILIRISE